MQNRVTVTKILQKTYGDRSRMFVFET